VRETGSRRGDSVALAIDGDAEAGLVWLLTPALVLVWVVARTLLPGRIEGEFAVGAKAPLPFFFFDASWLLLLPALLLWYRRSPGRRSAALTLCLLTAAVAAGYAARSLIRYWRGHANAWDLGNFAQPLWRAAHGYGMTSTWHDGRPLWGDHGSFAFYLYTPLARLGDPSQALLVAQAVLVAAWIPVVYLYARALRLDRGLALALGCVAAASRPIENGAFFDFHPECALPLLLLGVLLCHRREHRLGMLACALAAAASKDIAALTVGMALLYLAVVERRLRKATALAGGLVAALALFDIFLLSRLTGWYSYLHMNTSAPTDVALGLKAALLRAGNTLVLPWAHPFTLMAGLPWAAAATMSPKAGLKGVDFQYAFLFAPVALAGAVMLCARVVRRFPRRAPGLVMLWAAATVAINASRPFDLGPASAWAIARQRRAFFDASGLRGEHTVAADNCTGALVAGREVVLPLCYVDFERFARTGEEPIDVPVDPALDVDRIVANLGPGSNDCIRTQVERARARGYRELGRGGELIVLGRPEIPRQASNRSPGVGVRHTK
jgi:uncharacterized membrane protein